MPVIPSTEYNEGIPWEVEYTNEFDQWWHELSEVQQDSVTMVIELLMIDGPNLQYPYSSDIRGLAIEACGSCECKATGCL